MNGTSVQAIDPAADGRWDAFVSRAPGSSIFHHSSWKTVVERTFHATPIYLTVQDDSKSVLAGIPFFFRKSVLAGSALISLPFSDFCDILTDDPDRFGMLWRAVLDEAREKRAGYIEIRARDNGAIDLASYGLTPGRTYLNHFLEIRDDLAYMEKRVIEKSYKYDIRQARKSGLVVEAAAGEAPMKQYYRLYVMTRGYHGLPPIPYVFFKHIWEVLSPSKRVYLFLAYFMERPVAGIIFLRHNGCLYALSNSSDRRFLCKKPNHLLWWRGIELAVELGVGVLDFGRTSPDNKGLRFFKKRWGTRETEIHHYRYDMDRHGRPLGANGHAFARIERALPGVLRRLPPWALRAVGSIAYRHMYI